MRVRGAVIRARDDEWAGRAAAASHAESTATALRAVQRDTALLHRQLTHVREDLLNESSSPEAKRLGVPGPAKPSPPTSGST